METQTEQTQEADKEALEEVVEQTAESEEGNPEKETVPTSSARFAPIRG
jgi:hypothetical protein